MGHDPIKCESCRMRALATAVHENRADLRKVIDRKLREVKHLGDQLQVAAMQLGLFAARVILKSPACVASVTVTTEALGVAAATPAEVLEKLLDRLHGGRRPEDMETRRN